MGNIAGKVDMVALGQLLGRNLEGYVVTNDQQNDGVVTIQQKEECYLNGNKINISELIVNPWNVWTCNSYYYLFSSGNISSVKYCHVLNKDFEAMSTFEKLPALNPIDSDRAKIVLAALGEQVGAVFAAEHAQEISATRAMLIRE